MSSAPSSDSGTAAAELLAEYLARCEAGERPSPQDFAARHPAEAGTFLEALSTQ